MIRIALYLVCATGVAVIGTRMVQWSTSSAQAQYALFKADRAEEEWCRDSAAHRPEIPPRITRPAEERKEKSRIVRALLGVIDEFDPDNEDGEDNARKNAEDRDAFDGDLNTSETRGLLRRVLREADPELARSLGKNSLRLIAEANCKPDLPIYLHCDHEVDDEFEHSHVNGVHVIEWKKERAGVDRECPHQVRPLRWGTVENPIPPKNDPRPEVERRQREREQGTEEPAGENPFGAR